jgi:heme/copper-type cytochrome/quinol oxidase subunit 2
VSTPPDQPPPGPLSAARTVALAASVVLLLAVVSIAARSGDHDRAYPGGSAAATTGHHALVWVLLVLGPIAGVLGLALFLYAQVMRRRDPDLMAALRKRSRLRRRIMLAAFVALIAYSVATDQNPALVIMNLLRDLFGSFNVGHLNPFAAPAAPPNQHAHTRRDGGGVSGVDWALVGVTWIVLVVAAGLLIRRFRRRRAAADDPSSARAELEPADLGLERLRNERDPRRAVIGAYALMDRLMADRALGRRRSEAPLEYLGRMTAAGFARITALGRLTRLYARARFSTHPIDRAMQADAVDAVETIAAESAE